MLLHVLGQERTIGGAHLSTWSQGYLGMLNILRLMEPYLFPSGFHPPSGPYISQWFCASRVCRRCDRATELPISDTLILTGQSGANLFKDLPNTPILALRFVFDVGSK